MTIWTRDHTKEWIHQLENRVEDIGYYLMQTLDWCDHNGIYNNKTVFTCCAVSCIWVAAMRGEKISFRELLEIMGIDEGVTPIDKIYTGLGPEFQNAELEDLLEIIARINYDF